MSNPLMQMMGGTSQPSQQSSDFMAQAIQAYRNGTINQFGEKQFQENPQFRQFIENMKGKNPFQIAKANGMDLGQIMKKM